MRKIVIAVAAICVAAAILPPSAGATFPAKNGRLAFKRFLDPAHTTSAIFAIDPNGRHERQLSHPPAGVQDAVPDWSPDGSRVAFARCRIVGLWCEVWTAAADGSGETRLGPDCFAVGPLPACEYRDVPAYSPTSTIAFAHVYFDPGGVLHGELAEMDGAGAILRTISPGSGPPPAGAAWSYSPDGKRIAVSLLNSAAGTPPNASAVYILNADGSGGLQQITPFSLNGGDGPDWSPDGRRIVFRSNAQSRDGTGSQLYTVRPDGSDLTQITHFGPDTKVLSASFSPNGNWITVSLTGVGGLPDVYVMRTDGHALRPVTRTPDWDSGTDWGPRPPHRPAGATLARVTAGPPASNGTDTLQLEAAGAARHGRAARQAAPVELTLSPRETSVSGGPATPTYRPA